MAVADGSDDDGMGTEEGVDVKSPFSMRSNSNMAACSAANSSNSWDRAILDGDDDDWLMPLFDRLRFDFLPMLLVSIEVRGICVVR